MKIDEKGSLGVIRIKKGRGGGNPKDLGIMAGKKCLGAGHIAVGVDVDDPGEDVGEILERIDIVDYKSVSISEAVVAQCPAPRPRAQLWGGHRGPAHRSP